MLFSFFCQRIKSIKTTPFISTFSGHKTNNVGPIQQFTFLKARKYAIAKLEKLGIFDNKKHSLYFNQLRNDHGKLLAMIQDNQFVVIIDEVIFTKSPGILALVFGDSCYDPIVSSALKCNWIVETWFWNMGMSGELKNKTILDYHYKFFSCSFGLYFRKNNLVLEVIGHALQNWGNKEMTDMFAPLNLFC
ncbi:nyn domain-containing protein [Gigaspora margarita]|uniref:Nyn domain-containing protein n=1 Tax=Gigaspora margarita TaxID=4874 RepID=A0A8H4EMT8_GIGMA|nr:nyn domain-containing protein [Gigaspora margarita]